MFSVKELPEYVNAKEQFNIEERFKKIINRKISFLTENPRHPSLECHEFHTICKINGKETTIWSFYVNDKYRIDFVYGKDKKIYLINFSNHHEQLPKKEYFIKDN